MSAGDDEELSQLVAELVTALRDLESELDPPRGPRPPTPRELRRFASEVAIPGVILVLETNIRALRLLQRALEIAERADHTREELSLDDRARSVSETTLEGLDDALGELENVIHGRPDSAEAASLLADARRLHEDVQTRLAEYGNEADYPADREDSQEPEGEGTEEGSAGGADDRDTSSPSVNVDAELESIKAELDEKDGTGADAADNAGANGEADAENTDAVGDSQDDGAENPHDVGDSPDEDGT